MSVASAIEAQAKRSQCSLHFDVRFWFSAVIVVMWVDVEQLAGREQPGQLDQFFSRASTTRR